MKNHLFCVGVEVTSAAGGQRSEAFVSAQLNAYVGANDLHEALSRVEQALQRDGYAVSFIRGCWVVDAACNDGFCPVDELPSEIGGGLLFSDEVHYGEMHNRTSASDYGY